MRLNLSHVAKECGQLVMRERPAAAISGVRLRSMGETSTVRSPLIWPDESLPLLDVHLPEAVFGMRLDDALPSLLDAVWAALSNTPDRERTCPTCRKPYAAVCQ